MSAVRPARPRRMGWPAALALLLAAASACGAINAEEAINAAEQ